MEMFAWGFFGSFAVEIGEVYMGFKAGRPFPRCYGKRWFWPCRLLIALVGGAIACCLGADTPILAFQVGASTPIFLQRYSDQEPSESVER
jgi:hypothetical protein